jgi:hypothetical protein
VFGQLAYHGHGAPLDASDCTSDHLGVKSASGSLEPLLLCSPSPPHSSPRPATKISPADILVKRREAIQLLRIMSGTSRARPVFDKPSNSWLSIVTSLFKDTVLSARRQQNRDGF